MPHEHLIQAYNDEAFLADTVAGFLATGLAQGEGAIVVATPRHVDLFETTLRRKKIDVAAATAGRQLLILDAQRTMDQFLVNGRPDRARFAPVISAALDHVRGAGHAHIRIYGEMVDLLWTTSVQGTIELEQLWNEILRDPTLSLLCGYQMDPLDRHTQGLLRRVTRCHSRLLPVEDHEAFDDAVLQAYRDVFGPPADADVLRQLMADTVRRETEMPPALGALFALEDFSKILVDDVRLRAASYYRTRRRRAG